MMYQVVILGPGEPQLGSRLRLEISSRLTEFGPTEAASTTFIGLGDRAGLTSTTPTVAVFLGGDSSTNSDEAAALVRDAVPVIPVVSATSRFRELVPPALHPINGVEVDWAAPNFSDTVNLVLENLGLLRRTRRLFISYLRSESTPIAHQLRVAFDDAGYDPFLDTSGVPRGHDFQSILWHRLLDSDVAIILDTPDFLTSRWTTEEVANAQAMSVGMVRVVWPKAPDVPAADLALQLYLDHSDFQGTELTEAAVSRVVNATAALRARCVAARHTNLIVEFCSEAARVGVATSIQPDRYVVATLPNGRRIAAVPAVGVPDASVYHEASQRFPSAGGSADEAVFIYDHRGMLPAWGELLEWLDGYLPVHGLRVTDTAAKLGV